MTTCVYLAPDGLPIEVPAPGQQPLTISASVGVGGQNRKDDVLKIQVALNRVSLPPGGGQELKVDGINGPATMAAISNFQNAHFGTADGRVDPGGRTLLKLQSLLVAGRKERDELGVNSSDPRLHAELMALAEETRPVAQVWVEAALRELTAARSTSASTPALGVLAFHFHFDPASASFNAHVASAENIYQLMLIALGRPALFGTNMYSVDEKGLPREAFAEAECGGYHVGSQIRLCPPFANLWLKSRTACVVHELAHFVGGRATTDQIGHFAFELPLPDGSPSPGKARTYAQLTPTEALHNAATYATYACHAYYGFDNRAGWL